MCLRDVDMETYKGRYAMTWEEYYDKFYDWSESTQVNKLSSVEALGPADEVTEILMEFAFNREEIANRLARKAVAQNVVFSADNLMDFIGSIDVELQNQLACLAVIPYRKRILKSLTDFWMQIFLLNSIRQRVYRSRRS